MFKKENRYLFVFRISINGYAHIVKLPGTRYNLCWVMHNTASLKAVQVSNRL